MDSNSQHTMRALASYKPFFAGIGELLTVIMFAIFNAFFPSVFRLSKKFCTVNKYSKASEQRSHYKHLPNSLLFTLPVTLLPLTSNILILCSTGQVLASLNNRLPCILSSERVALLYQQRAATPCNCSGSLCLFICYALASVQCLQPGKQAPPAPAGEASTGEQGRLCPSWALIPKD